MYNQKKNKMEMFWILYDLCIKKIFEWICKFLHIKITEKNTNLVIQFFRFGIVGLSNTLISYFTYLISFWIFLYLHIFPTIDYLIAQVISFFLGVVWSFFWNNKYVFYEENRANLFMAFFKMLITYSFTGLILNSLLLYFWVDILNFSKIIAPLFNLIISVPINFILNRQWAFSKK